RAIKEEQGRTRRLDAELAAANDQLVKIDVARSQHFKEVARPRLKFLSGDDILTPIDQTDRQALALLSKRSDVISDIHDRLDEGEKARAELEARRNGLGDKLEEAAAAIDDAEVAVQERLKVDPAYAEQRR